MYLCARQLRAGLDYPKLDNLKDDERKFRQRGKLVRVTFLVAPFKSRMIRRMTEDFSPRIEYQIVHPNYPATSVERRARSVAEKLDDQLIGGKSVREAIARFQPDIVYSDNALYTAQFKLSSLFSRERIPLILHLRGDWWREYWAWFETASPRKRALSAQQYAYNWTSVATAKKITPICKWLERIVKHNLPWKKTEVVYQGVAPEQFYHEDGLTFKHPAVAVIQNHSIYPKVMGLLQFKRIAQKLPNIHFYIAEGEPEGQQFLPNVKQAYSGLTNVHFVEDIINVAAVRRMLTACDCYVLATGLDCCPTTILEASLMERPVVASRIGGVPEIVLEGETGWTIENTDSDSWTEKLSTLAQDSKLCRRMGEVGKKWVADEFGWRRIAGQVEVLLRNEAR